MGSGRGGLHEGTWGSREGEELRARVSDALKQFGDAAVGDAAAELAEVLASIASGDSPEDAAPEPGDIAFDLALDALAPFIPGSGRITRELGHAAKYSERASRAKKSFAPRVPGEIWVEPDEYAKAMREVNGRYAQGLLKPGDLKHVWTDDYIYTVQVGEPGECFIIGKEALE